MNGAFISPPPANQFWPRSVEMCTLQVRSSLLPSGLLSTMTSLPLEGFRAI